MSANRNLLRASDGYGWCYVLNTQVESGVASVIDNAQDNALIVHRQAYDRTNPTESEIIASVLRVLTTFNVNTFIPDLNLISTAPPLAARVAERLNGIRHMMQFAPADRMSTISTSTDQWLWRAIFYMFRVVRGKTHVCTDRELIAAFDALRMKQPQPISMLDIYNQVRPTAATKRCVYMHMLPPNPSEVPLSTMDDVRQLYANATPNLFDIKPKLATGACLVRRNTVRGDLTVQSALSLRVVLDAYDFHSPVTVSDLPAQRDVAPFQYLVSSVLSRNIAGAVIELDISNVDEAARTGVMDGSRTATFFHAAYFSGCDHNVFFNVLAVENMIMADRVLVMDLAVEERDSGSPTALRAPPASLPPGSLIAGTVVTEFLLACNDRRMDTRMVVSDLR